MRSVETEKKKRSKKERVHLSLSVELLLVRLSVCVGRKKCEEIRNFSLQIYSVKREKA